MQIVKNKCGDAILVVMIMMEVLVMKIVLHIHGYVQKVIYITQFKHIAIITVTLRALQIPKHWVQIMM